MVIPTYLPARYLDWETRWGEMLPWIQVDRNVQKEYRVRRDHKRGLSGNEHVEIGRELFMLRRQERSCPSVPRKGPSCQFRSFDFPMGNSATISGSDLLLHLSPSGIYSVSKQFYSGGFCCVLWETKDYRPRNLTSLRKSPLSHDASFVLL